MAVAEPSHPFASFLGAHPVGTIVLVILFRLVITALAQLCKRPHTNWKREMTIVVKWGRQRILLPLPPPDTTLQAFRRSLAEYTQLPEQSFKLVHSGAVMKGDAPISTYNIRENSVIVLIGGADLTPKTVLDRNTEHTVIALIRSELDQVRSTLTPSVDSFLHTLVSQSPDDSSVAPRHKGVEKEHMRLAELLLQALLRLDAIATEGGWEEARAERKDAVKEVQGLLDRLDEGWTTRPQP